MPKRIIVVEVPVREMAYACKLIDQMGYCRLSGEVCCDDNCMGAGRHAFVKLEEE